MVVRRKHTDLSLGLKMEIIQLVQEKLSQQEITTRFGCSQSAVSKIVKTKETVMREEEENMVSTRKRKRRGKAEDMEAALYKWFVDARVRDAPVTSAVLEEKANHLAALLGSRDFKSHEWLAVQVEIAQRNQVQEGAQKKERCRH